MCKPTQNDSDLPERDGEYYRLVVQLAHTHMLDLKGRQLQVTNYGLLLYGAIYFLSREVQPPPRLVPILTTLVCIVANVFLWSVHCAIARARARARRASKCFPAHYRRRFPKDTKRNRRTEWEACVVTSVLTILLVAAGWLVGVALQ